MKAIIHIGMEKAGSSSIQTWLRANRIALEGESVYPSNSVYPFKTEDMRSRCPSISGIPANALKHAIFHVAKDEMGVDEKTAWVGQTERNPRRDARYSENFKLLTDHLQGLGNEPGIFVYSLEGIYTCRKIQMIALDKYLSRFFENISYVIYIRNIVDFLPSMYAQKLRDNKIYNFATLDYSKFLDKCVSDLAPFGRESSFDILFDWEMTLGNKMNIRLLEPDWLVNGDLIEDFASLLGVGAFCKPGRINESIAAEYIEYVRMLNLVFEDSLPAGIRKKALQILTDESAGKQKLAMSDTQAESIQELHRDQEERIKMRFFPERSDLFSINSYGKGVSPVPLTERRKSEIDFFLQKQMEPEDWEPYKLARGGKCQRRRICSRANITLSRDIKR